MRAADKIVGTDVVKLMRLALTAAFPGVGFSVVRGRGTGRNWAHVRYTYGPAQADVEALVHGFCSEQFDGRDDGYHRTSKESRRYPEGVTGLSGVIVNCDALVVIDHAGLVGGTDYHVNGRGTMRLELAPIFTTGMAVMRTGDGFVEVPIRSLLYLPVRALALAFLEVMKDTIGMPALLDAARVNRRAAPGDTSCATHDHCDANMVMDAAFRRCFLRAPRLQDDGDLALFNEAWFLAKRADLKADAVAAGVERGA